MKNPFKRFLDMLSGGHEENEHSKSANPPVNPQGNVAGVGRQSLRNPSVHGDSTRPVSIPPQVPPAVVRTPQHIPKPIQSPSIVTGQLPSPGPALPQPLNKHEVTEEFRRLRSEIEKLKSEFDNLPALLKAELTDLLLSRDDIRSMMKEELCAAFDFHENLEDQIKSLREREASLASDLEREKRDVMSKSGEIADLRQNTNTQAERIASLAKDNKYFSDECEKMKLEIGVIKNNLDLRLGQSIPKGLLDSIVSNDVRSFDAAALRGDHEAVRVMAALFQLRASILPGSGPDDALVAVRALGSALHAAWTSKGMSPKDSHALFTHWQIFLNSLPDVGFQLVVPDLGQSVPQNVTPLGGVTKVSEVLLWIVKSANGSVYARGIVR